MRLAGSAESHTSPPFVSTMWPSKHLLLCRLQVAKEKETFERQVNVVLCHFRLGKFCFPCRQSSQFSYEGAQRRDGTLFLSDRHPP